MIEYLGVFIRVFLNRLTEKIYLKFRAILIRYRITSGISNRLKGLLRLNKLLLKLYIKNMVCIRCKMVVVKDELTKMGLHYTTVELGEAEIIENISSRSARSI